MSHTVKSYSNEPNEYSDFRTSQEIRVLNFEKEQADLLHFFSNEIACLGGPQNHYASDKVSFFALKIKSTFSVKQNSIIKDYINSLVSVLIFEDMKDFLMECDVPDICPPLFLIENHYDILYLGSRNQLLLKLVENEAFAYDIDNEGKLIRLVANFKGGGEQKIFGEPATVELSSHAGISLGPHTEAPYNCCYRSKNGVSPSPSSLILSAMWNPASEATSIIPVSPILNKIGIENTLALMLNYFNFTRSDSFSNNNATLHESISIIDFDGSKGFSIRFNSYRFSVDGNAPDIVKKAYDEFCNEINLSQPYQYALTRRSALVINNYRALHCRDIVKDNRRMLVRLFGVSNGIESNIISKKPLILKG